MGCFASNIRIFSENVIFFFCKKLLLLSHTGSTMAVPVTVDSWRQSANNTLYTDSCMEKKELNKTDKYLCFQLGYYTC